MLEYMGWPRVEADEAFVVTGRLSPAMPANSGRYSIFVPTLEQGQKDKQRGCGLLRYGVITELGFEGKDPLLRRSFQDKRWKEAPCIDLGPNCQNHTVEKMASKAEQDRGHAERFWLTIEDADLVRPRVYRGMT